MSEEKRGSDLKAAQAAVETAAGVSPVIDSALSTQHSALLHAARSTQHAARLHSARSTQHSALSSEHSARGLLGDAERLAEEMAGRWRRGERPPAEEYLARLPGLRDDGEAAVELIYEEVCLRQQYGPPVEPDEFL